MGSDNQAERVCEAHELRDFMVERLQTVLRLPDAFAQEIAAVLVKAMRESGRRWSL